MLNNKLDGLSLSGWNWRIITVIIGGSGVAVYLLVNIAKRKDIFTLKAKEETANPYESNKYCNEYLAFNYGGPSVNCLFDGPKNCYDFPKRAAEICLKHYQASPSVPHRALDIGCAVGRASFELSQGFPEVIGVDFSHSFLKTCNALKRSGRMKYEMITEGILTTKHEAIVPPHLKRQRCHFQHGNACNLPLHLGEFGCVLAANIICRLPSPMDFLLRLSSLVASGGICVLISPYTFMEYYTDKAKWLGGYFDENGKEVRAFDRMKSVLGPHFVLVDSLELPYLIRETAREHQWAVSHATVWKRK